MAAKTQEEKPPKAAPAATKKEQILRWFAEEKSRRYLSGDTASKKLKTIGIDVTAKYINTIKKELPE